MGRRWPSGETTLPPCTPISETPSSTARTPSTLLLLTGSLMSSLPESRREEPRSLSSESSPPLLPPETPPSTTWETGLTAPMSGNPLPSSLTANSTTSPKALCSPSLAPPLTVPTLPLPDSTSPMRSLKPASRRLLTSSSENVTPSPTSSSEQTPDNKVIKVLFNRAYMNAQMHLNSE